MRLVRIGILSQWYAPEPGPAALVAVTAKALAARGHEVHVLTGFPNYPSGAIAPGYHQTPLMREELDGVRVTRVPLYPSHDRSAARRIGNYASFGVCGLCPDTADVSDEFSSRHTTDETEAPLTGVGVAGRRRRAPRLVALSERQLP